MMPRAGCAECAGKGYTHYWHAYVAVRENPSVPFLRAARTRFCPYCMPTAYWKDYALRAD